MDPKGFLDNFIVNWLLKQLDKVISDQAAVREFVLKIIGTLEDLAEKTATKWDDLAVDGLAYVVKDDEAWAYAYGRLYALYQQIVNGDRDEPLPLPTKTEIEDDAERAGLNPVLIAALIEAAIALFQWWRDRRGT
jgi:hypothetical protein